MSKIKRGVLLVNLGTPAEPTKQAVREFLRVFLSDPRVVDLPRIIWLPILYGIILNVRPGKVAKNYQTIWTDLGSPLMATSIAQCEQLQKLFDQDPDADYRVELGMTYLNPSIESGFRKLKEWGAEKVVVLPLYPQYSTSTTASVLDQIDEVRDQFDFEIDMIEEYHNNPDYILALADSVKDHINDVDKLVMSFHGIPKRYVVKKGDPYQKHCEETARLVAESLNLGNEKWEMAYQSRVGKEEWLKPYLDERMEALPGEGTKKIVAICPGFSADCLETLEEIAMENQETFIEAGGESFTYVEALNDSPSHIAMMKRIVESKFQAV